MSMFEKAKVGGPIILADISVIDYVWARRFLNEVEQKPRLRHPGDYNAIALQVDQAQLGDFEVIVWLDFILFYLWFWKN